MIHRSRSPQARWLHAILGNARSHATTRRAVRVAVICLVGLGLGPLSRKADRQSGEWTWRSRRALTLLRAAVLGACCLLVSATPAHSQTGSASYTTFDAVGAGTGMFQGTLGVSINASGVITGFYIDSFHVAHGFIRAADGTITYFDAPSAGTSAGQGTHPVAINANGDVAGIYVDSNSAYHGFVRPAASGILTQFDAPGASTSTKHRGTTPTGIDAAGDVEGMYRAADDVHHGFQRFSNGTFISFDASTGGTSATQGTTPLAVNAGGFLTGDYKDQNNLHHGFAGYAGTTFMFDVPAASSTTSGIKDLCCGGTYPFSVDAGGSITGIYTDSSGVYHGFVRAQSGSIRTFDAPGAGTTGLVPGTAAFSINTDGDIVGAYQDSAGVVHGFLLAANGTLTAPLDDPSAGPAGSTMLPGTITFSINDSGTVTGGYFDSHGVAHGFVLTGIPLSVATPTLSPPGGTYTSSQSVTISDTTPGAQIFYTTNDTTPSPSSTPYTGPITVNTNETIQAIAVATGYSNSAVATATYTVNLVQYTIGGTVSGLTGSGLVLQDNGAGNLSIISNGMFTFMPFIGSGDPYNVTVLTQPSSPAQNCAVTNGSGTAASNVTNVQVTCSTTPSYTIGGNVSGLAGSGLVLQDNGGNNLSITANGSFTFSTLILSGGAYSVMVFIQPTNPAQNCSVTNGSGMATSNVTNVQIICTTIPSYTLGGNISGLAGSGLVLQDNGGGNLSITANGTFTFAATVPSGNSYNVTVLTQPANPAQNCSVTNGSGTATSNVTNVQVTCTTTVTYTIGGMVTGLAGTGLVLQNNNGNNLAVTANGSFTFSTPVTAGGGYEVTVLVHPINPVQNCVVTSGSGIASANVTNVQVTCTTVRFTIGGAVSGLAGTGLVIQDNGGDNLPISANGNFTFPTAVLSGGSYNVTILTQPSNPAQFCSVIAGTGTATGNVLDVEVSCGTIVNSQVPMIFGLTPASIQAESGAFALLISGNNFAQGATLNFQGATLTTKFSGPTTLVATVPASSISSSGIVPVLVANPPSAGGIVSQPFIFVIDSPAGSMGAFTVSSTTSNLTVQAGQMATLQITLTGVMAGATVSAQCYNLPASASCSYNNNVVTITTTPGTPAGTYSALVTVAAIQHFSASAQRRPVYIANLVWLAGLPLGLLWMGDGRKRRLRGRFVLLFGLLLLLLAGCGGGTTSSGKTLITTTTQSSLPFTLTVQ